MQMIALLLSLIVLNNSFSADEDFTVAPVGDFGPSPYEKYTNSITNEDSELREIREQIKKEREESEAKLNKILKSENKEDRPKRSKKSKLKKSK
jgi:hypothetical protein